MGRSGRRSRRTGVPRRAVRALVVASASVVVTSALPALSGAASSGTISVVAAENEYGNVVSQIGGRYVQVLSVESNPNTDPHTYEVSPNVANAVAGASLVIQNGVGYDSYMSKIESASPNSGRAVINVQRLLGLPDNTPNPHLWYAPRTMPAVAVAVGNALGRLRPSQAAYFRQRVAAFVASLQPWRNAIASFKARYAGTRAATTEPVADYLLQAMGINNLTPFGFQADIMNGTDPTPQDIALENGFFSRHMVKVFAYNQQVVSTLTESIRTNAQQAGVPVVGVYETMPTGYSYQRWMLAETNALLNAVASGKSTLHL